MNKSDLVGFIKSSTGMSAGESESALDALIEAAKNELAQGGQVRLVGFGKMFVKDRPERQGRNPKTGDPITLAASKQVMFKPGSKLMAAVQTANSDM